jgi:hypothetical protein
MTHRMINNDNLGTLLRMYLPGWGCHVQHSDTMPGINIALYKFVPYGKMLTPEELANNVFPTEGQIQTAKKAIARVKRPVYRGRK